MKILATIILFVLLLPENGQTQVLKRLGKKIEQKANQRANQKTDAAIDKGLDQVEQTADKKKKAAAENNEKESKEAKENKAATNTTQSDNENRNKLLINTDFDFVPGDKTIFSEKFSTDNIGDFPASWNTNGSGEVVTFNDQTTRWLKIPDNTLTYPELNKKILPENFTIEFDLLFPGDDKRPPITFGFSENTDPVKDGLNGKKMFYFVIEASTDHINYNNSIYSSNENSKNFSFSKFEKQVIPVSINVNKSRIRLYLNQDKIFDLPRAFEPADLLRKNFHFRASPIIPAKEAFYISNVRIAESGVDLRSQLMKNGRASTTAIHFGINSVTILPNSSGAIREIVKAMEANADLKIKIVGHTDTDGEADQNLILSRKRADAVKQIMVSNFGIDGLRIETEGKGETEPLTENKTAEEKFENRRVEFIKI